MDALKPWIHEKLTEILGFEDDVVIDYAINQLESTNTPNAKSIQINLTGFLNAKVSFFIFRFLKGRYEIIVTDKMDILQTSCSRYMMNLSLSRYFKSLDSSYF